MKGFSKPTTFGSYDRVPPEAVSIAEIIKDEPEIKTELQSRGALFGTTYDYEERLALLYKYRCLNNSVLITGQPGSGKTVLSDAFGNIALDLDDLGQRELPYHDLTKQVWTVRPDLIRLVESSKHRDYYMGTCENLFSDARILKLDDFGNESTAMRGSLMHVIPWRLIIVLVHDPDRLRIDGKTQYEFRFGPACLRTHGHLKTEVEYRAECRSQYKSVQRLSSLRLQSAEEHLSSAALLSPVVLLDVSDVPDRGAFSRAVERIVKAYDGFCYEAFFDDIMDANPIDIYMPRPTDCFSLSEIPCYRFKGDKLVPVRGEQVEHTIFQSDNEQPVSAADLQLGKGTFAAGGAEDSDL